VTSDGGFGVRPLAEGDDLAALFALVRGVFTALKVDPPSGMGKETLDDLRRRAREQIIFVAAAGNALIGSVFCEPQGAALYVGRLAVAEARRRHGVGAALMQAAETHARKCGFAAVTLRSRIALPGNVAFFRNRGFVIVAEKCHPGFQRPTFYEMRLDL
jgi:predicted N-acetyltransferase YhbS